MLDKAALKLNQRRWQKGAEVATEEERQRSPLQRWQQLNALYRMAFGLQLLSKASSQEKKRRFGTVGTI